MKKKFLLSVVIPCYNCAETVSETIYSIINQSLVVDVEIICIDDCSTDRTSQVLESLRSETGILSIYKTESRSGRPSIPRNIGIEKSSGEILMFMDADDVLPIDYLEKCLSYVTDKQFAGSLKHTFKSSVPPSDFYNDQRGKSFRVPKLMLYSKNMFSMSGLLVKRSCLKNVKFENSYLEDWRFLVRLRKNNVQGLLFICPRIFYRTHDNSITPKRKIKQVKRVFLTLKRMHGLNSQVFFIVGYFLFGILKIVLEKYAWNSNYSSGMKNVT